MQSHYLLAVAKRLVAEEPQKYEGVTFPRDEWELLGLFRGDPTPQPPPPGGEGGKASEGVAALHAGVTESSSGGLSPPSEEGVAGGTLGPPSRTAKGAGGLGSPRSAPLYVVVEKILGDGEALPPEWVCDGTVGYEFAVATNGLFVDPAGEAPLTAAYQTFTGRDEPFHAVAHDGKLQILNSSLASELWALSHQLDRIARLDRRSRDFTLNGVRRALREVIACFPVYRSYVNGGASPTDKAAVGRAVHWARKRNPTLGKPLFDFIRDTVLLKDSPSGPATEDYRALQRRFAGKFQQVTAPVTAKGVEDTALYVYNRLVSLNEVGGEPGRFGWPADRVHKFLAERGAAQPGGLSPLSTHDTKRGEDVRARLNVLSELPHEWADAVARWSALNRRHKTPNADADTAPDANEEWLIYQTLVGVWPEARGESGKGGEGAGEKREVGAPGDPPADPPAPGEDLVARIQAYMKKALCEAKVHSSWINPDGEYEAAVAEFVRKVLDAAESAEFLTDLGRFVERVAFFGRINAIAQTVIRCTVPGVPDTYQGTEAWDLSLVDPDNRRPVEYASRAAWLAELDGRAGAERGPCRVALELSKHLADPRAKLYATSRALRCRKEHAALFAGGEYVPLSATGARADNLFGFARVRGDEAAVVAVPRLVTKLVPDGARPPLGRKVWGDTAVSLPAGVPHGTYRNALTGERVELSDAAAPAAELFGVFPAAILVRAESAT
ncbi:MAG: malto-oligosyltrehalose synthase [Planctomycetes bacterium]|nr:malto-oligosyltrehalose synthase [Planctomycetota bacterium]